MASNASDPEAHASLQALSTGNRSAVLRSQSPAGCSEPSPPCSFPEQPLPFCCSRTSISLASMMALQTQQGPVLQGRFELFRPQAAARPTNSLQGRPDRDWVAEVPPPCHSADDSLICFAEATDDFKITGRFFLFSIVQRGCSLMHPDVALSLHVGECSVSGKKSVKPAAPASTKVRTPYWENPESRRSLQDSTRTGSHPLLQHRPRKPPYGTSPGC